MKGYKDLKVWQANQTCIKEALQLLDDLPRNFAYEHIGKQLFRAISSIGANLAEGYGSFKGKEYSRYIDISLRSAIETDHWLSTLKNLLGNNSDGLIENLSCSNVEVIRMLQGLKKAIEDKRTQQP